MAKTMAEYNIAPYSEDAMPQTISPEGAEIANTYLENACSIKATSEALNLPTHTISAALHDPMVRSYVTGILRETGYRHMENILNKLDEELREFNLALGAEYWYNDIFSVRAGYFWEHASKGNRKYVTLGVGLKLNVFSLDFAYLVPTNGQESPLANTLRFTLSFDFDSLNL